MGCVCIHWARSGPRRCHRRTASCSSQDSSGRRRPAPIQRPTTAIQKKAGCGRPIPRLSLDSARLTLRALCYLCPHRLPEPAFTLPAKRNKPCPTCHPRIVHLRHCTNAQTTPADHPGIRDGEGRVRYGRTVASPAHGPTWRGQRGAPSHVMTCHALTRAIVDDAVVRRYFERRSLRNVMAKLSFFQVRCHMSTRTCT